jgi:hypothetical protein
MKLDEKLMLEKAYESVKNYCTSLLNPNSLKTKDTELGSGIFVTLNGRRGILTNSHVAEMFFLNKIFIPQSGLSTDLLSLSISEIIDLPALSRKNDNNEVDVDLAFIVIDEEDSNQVIEIHKKFWDLDCSANRWSEKDLRYENSIFLIVGAIDEGKVHKKDPESGEESLFYKNAGYFIVVPDFEEIKNDVCFYNDLDISVKIDNIVCPIKTQSIVPSKLYGLSGAPLWKVTLNASCDEVESFILIGIATQYGPESKAEKIVCRGPKTLFEGFYPYCLAKIRDSHLSYAKFFF